MPAPQAPATGAHLATLNLFREPDGTAEITVADGVGALHEIEQVIVEAAVRMFARRNPLPAEQQLAEHPGAANLAYAIAMRYAKPLAFARAAMQDFVDKVDRGEARSKRSYARFKQALAVMAEAFPNLPPVETPPTIIAPYGTHPDGRPRD
jgi:hypothetical protein